jgi:hypothetical protein
MNPPYSKQYLQNLISKTIEEEKIKKDESETDRMRRLLIKADVDAITENAYFHAKIGNIYYKKEFLNKDLILDIYDKVKINFPDCKIYLKLQECSLMVYWG